MSESASKLVTYDALTQIDERAAKLVTYDALTQIDERAAKLVTYLALTPAINVTKIVTYLALSPGGPSTILNMANVVVTSLLTESACTVAQFPIPPTNAAPSLGMRFSDTRGATYGNAVPQPFSADPLMQPIWRRTGLARDRVYELFWSAAFATAVDGAFVEVEGSET